MRVCSSSFFLIRDPASVPISRQRLGRLIRQWEVRTDNDSGVALDTVISELVTNAVQHTTGAMLTVGVHANLDLRRLIIEVYDGSQVMPRQQAAGPDAEAGRGMFLIERLALAHGAEHTVRGKKVWAEVALPTVDQMCPPLGAAVLGLQCREDDTELIEALTPLGDRATTRETTAGRALLNVLRGHCNSPIAGFARSLEDEQLGLRAMVFSPDGARVLEARQSAGQLSPEALGMGVAATLIRDGARNLIDAIAH